MLDTTQENSISEAEAHGKTSVQTLFDWFVKEICPMSVQTPIEIVNFLDENFHYLIQLQEFDKVQGKYVDVRCSKVLPLLRAGKFSDENHKISDPRRPRELHSLPKFLSNPDTIWPNLGYGLKRGNGNITGQFIYVKGHPKERDIRVAFTIPHSEGKGIVVVSSFRTSWQWLQTKRAQYPCYFRSPAFVPQAIK